MTERGMTGGTETETRMVTSETNWRGIDDIARIGVEIEIGAEIIINITETEVTEDVVGAEKVIVIVIKDIIIIVNLLCASPDTIWTLVKRTSDLLCQRLTTSAASSPLCPSPLSPRTGRRLWVTDQVLASNYQGQVRVMRHVYSFQSIIMGFLYQILVLVAAIMTMKSLESSS